MEIPKSAASSSSLASSSVVAVSAASSPWVSPLSSPVSLLTSPLAPSFPEYVSSPSPEQAAMVKISRIARKIVIALFFIRPLAFRISYFIFLSLHFAVLCLQLYHSFVCFHRFFFCLLWFFYGFYLFPISQTASISLSISRFPMNGPTLILTAPVSQVPMVLWASPAQ